MLQIQGALKKLFQDLPKSDKTIGKNDRYLSIKSAVESREVQLEMEFIKSIKPLFDDFLTKFQKEEPMVHLLSPSCQNLLKGVMGRLLKSTTFSGKEGKDLKSIPAEDVSTHLPDKDIIVMQGKFLNGFGS